ncbi:MAG: hypothetical protein J0H64_09395 [Actinobacteria bacterium]|nr:hypothetical protein [Actinomycetota bacterium]
MFRAADYYNHGAPTPQETERSLRLLLAASLIEAGEESAADHGAARSSFRLTPEGRALRSSWTIAHTWATVLLGRLRCVPYPPQRGRGYGTAAAQAQGR